MILTGYLCSRLLLNYFCCKTDLFYCFIVWTFVLFWLWKNVGTVWIIVCINICIVASFLNLNIHIPWAFYGIISPMFVNSFGRYPLYIFLLPFSHLQWLRTIHWMPSLKVFWNSEIGGMISPTAGPEVKLLEWLLVSLSCVGVSSWSYIACKLQGSLRFICFLHFLDLVTDVELLCCRSSNRDPGAKAADTLSAKDHEGVIIFYSGNNRTPCSLL